MRSAEEVEKMAARATEAYHAADDRSIEQVITNAVGDALDWVLDETADDPI